MPAGYVVSFARFHEGGFGVPAHRFLPGLLHFYGIALHHLNPSGIQHIAVFIALCEGFLGIELHFDLWRHFSAVDMYQKMVGSGARKTKVLVPMGSANIHLRCNRAEGYIPCKLVVSNKGVALELVLLEECRRPLPAITAPP